MANWSDDDIELFKKLDGIVLRGYYVSGTELAELHNRVFGTNLKPTSCCSCNRMRFKDLKKSYDNIITQINERVEYEKEKNK